MFRHSESMKSEDALPHRKVMIDAADDQPSTVELLSKLHAATDERAFLSRYRFQNTTVAEYLNQLLEKKHLKRIDVVRASGINETFGYQIFMGQRNASRNKLLQLALAMPCELAEINRLLRIAGMNELYCKFKRDFIIIYCIDRGYSLQQINEELYDLGELTVSEPFGAAIIKSWSSSI